MAPINLASKRFRVAFSFAGEKRGFVSEIAGLLAQEFGKARVLYDKFHEAEFARRNLGIYLPELYHKECDLVVIIVSLDSDAKQWTGLEWTAIHDLLSQRKDDDVMLCRFDHATVTGLYSTAGFVELDGRKPEDIRDLIFDRLALIDQRREAEPASSMAPADGPARTSTPNNLPRLQPFFGRAAELATIREALDPDSRTWGALIDGPGGMGKTSLAVRAACDCPPGLFQRIVFVSVKDREMDDDGERPLGNLLVPGFLEMLNELARELGQPDIAKSPEDQRIRLLLDALRPAQALLILDNLESLPKTDRDQLFTFVKRLPPGCKAILTSRRRIGSGSEELILEKLDQDAALATLADLARRHPLLARTSEAERIALYTQTAGKPLLLRWVAGQLGRGSCRTFTDALAFLRTCPPDNDPLEFIFGDLSQNFSDAEIQILCALNYFRLPAQVEHIGEVVGGAAGIAVNITDVDTALRSLANRSLVIPDQEEKAFALVPMVSVFLQKKRPEILAQTSERLANRAFWLITEKGYGRKECYQLLDEAWPMIAAALPVFIAGPNSQLQKICFALRRFLETTGRWDEWRVLSLDAERKAVEVGDFSSAAWRAFDAGWFYYVRGQSALVLTCVERAAFHWSKAKVRKVGRSFYLRSEGFKREHRRASHLTEYRLFIRFCRKHFEEIENAPISLADLLAETALPNFPAEDGEETVGSPQLAKAANFREGMAIRDARLASEALVSSDFATAITCAESALTKAESTGRNDIAATASLCLATALLSIGSTSAALPHARRAVEIYSVLRHPDLEVARATLQECEE